MNYENEPDNRIKSIIPITKEEGLAFGFAVINNLICRNNTNILLLQENPAHARFLTTTQQEADIIGKALERERLFVYAEMQKARSEAVRKMDELNDRISNYQDIVKMQANQLAEVVERNQELRKELDVVRNTNNTKLSTAVSKSKRNRSSKRGKLSNIRRKQGR